tara:strand:+ start:1039 stop:1482 length:444 start_codon:yes stop_codon:yes gene_type:complete
MKIKNNWLNDELLLFLEQKFKHQVPHFYCEQSFKGGSYLYASNFNDNDTLINYLAFKLQRFLQIKLVFNRIYINVQHPGMDGSFHIDSGSDLTALYMVCGEGDFEIENECIIPFEKNKLIVFNSNLVHKGHAPKKGMRITLAFKINT